MALRTAQRPSPDAVREVDTVRSQCHALSCNAWTGTRFKTPPFLSVIQSLLYILWGNLKPRVFLLPPRKRS